MNTPQSDAYAIASRNCRKTIRATLAAVGLLIFFADVAAAVINESSTPRGRCYQRCDSKYVAKGRPNYGAWNRCMANCVRVYPTTR
jgi:hypothetical protein